MVFFAALRLLSARLPGRWAEVWDWIRSLEHAGWFMAYVFTVSQQGYLAAMMGVAVMLAVRAGYRDAKVLTGVVYTGVVTSLPFNTFLQVKITSGAIPEFLPTALRSFMLTYF